MGKVKLFKLVFDNATGIYKVGEILTGKLIVELKEPTHVTGIYLKLHGLADVHWSESADDFEDKEVYLNHTFTLFGKDYSKVEKYTPPEDRGQKKLVILTAGLHEFPFRHKLPETLPSSFQDEHGTIQYYCEISISRPWKCDHYQKYNFEVISLLDLNKEPLAKSPVKIQSSKTLKSGAVSVRLEINAMGYVPGSNIHINAEIFNHSGILVDRAKVFLQEKVTFRTASLEQKRSKTVTRNLAELKKGVIFNGEIQHWKNEILHIPPLLAPSKLDGCSIIDIDYELVMTLIPHFFHHDKLNVVIPLIIGTIPITESAPPLNPQRPIATSLSVRNPRRLLPNSSLPRPLSLPSSPIQIKFPRSVPITPPPAYEEIPSNQTFTIQQEDIQDDEDLEITSL